MRLRQKAKNTERQNGGKDRKREKRSSKTSSRKFKVTCDDAVKTRTEKTTSKFG